MSAIVSADGLYRYTLGRNWDPSLQRLTFVMLNPSTADAEADDPTIRRCVGFAKRDGFGGIKVVNLYAFRATDPRELRRAVDPIGPSNDAFLQLALTQALEDKSPVVVAWGAHADGRRVRQFVKLAGHTYPFHSLGTTKDGHPRHPLYLRNDAPMASWPEPSHPKENHV